MNRKAILCVLYATLLIIPAPILGRVVAKKKEEKRYAAVYPIAAYAGMTVSLPVFLALVAAYGAWKVARYHIRKYNINKLNSKENIMIYTLYFCFNSPWGVNQDFQKKELYVPCYI